MNMNRNFVLALAVVALVSSLAEAEWEKHIIHEGERTNTAIAGDFTGDGKLDVIANSGGKTRLFVAPDWKEHIIDDAGNGFIHSESFDVDGDGDLDFIGAQYRPGLVKWFEQPADATKGLWKGRVVDNEIIGIHGLLKGDIDKDGKMDLIANSGQPIGPFKNSAVWLSVPKNPRAAKSWQRHVFSKGDASGLSHYMGVGDVNGDGRVDISMAAKGGRQAEPGTGEWFAWWEAPADAKSEGWKKHLLHDKQPGATNIQQADVNGDGKVDFIATRGHGKGVIWMEAPSFKIHDINPDLKEPHCLQVVDMDGDGDMDAATCAYGSQIAAWFENDGKGNFKTHIVATNQAAYDIRAVDMDQDGDLDLLIAGQQSKNVVWCENPQKQVAQKRAKRILLIGQAPDGHPHGTHEYRAGMALLGKLLSRVKGVQVIVVSADGDWKAGPELIDSADGVVLFASEGGKWIQADAKRFAALQELSKRGGGFSCVHWGMGAKDVANISAFVNLFGGCHGGPDRRYKVVDVKMQFGKHPILKHVQPIQVHEEFYFKLKRPKNSTGFKSLVEVIIEDADHTVSWAWERPDGGRSFGFTGLHFHENWKHETYRRLMTQGVLWSVQVAIPSNGADVAVTSKDLELVLPTKK